jgi:hypothetical protein
VHTYGTQLEEAGDATLRVHIDAVSGGLTREACRCGCESGCKCDGELLKSEVTNIPIAYLASSSHRQ